MIRSRQLYAIFIPAILMVGLGLFIRITQFSKLKASEQAGYDTAQNPVEIPILPTDPILGFAESPITIVAFEDFACDGCRIQAGFFQQLLQTYPKKIKIVWKGLPVVRIPVSSEMAHTYGYCAQAQGKFSAFADHAFASGGSLTDDILHGIAQKIGLDEKRLTDCLVSPDPGTAIATTKQIATFLNIQSVPAIFVDNIQIQPPQFIEGWKSLLKL